MQRVTITMPEEILDAIRKRVANGHASSVSAYMSELAEQAVRRDSFLRLLDEIDAEEGPPSEEAQRWARDLFRRLD